MTLNIFKTILFPFLISSLITFIYTFSTYQQTDGFEEKQGNFIAVLMSLGICIFNLILSLLGFLNLNDSVRKNYTLSLLSYLILPVIFLITLLILYINNDNPHEKISDFLIIALSPIIFCLCLVVFHYQFYNKKINI